MDSGNKSIGSFCITSGNPPPAFEEKETVLYQMTQFVEIFVVLALLPAILFRRNYGFHTCRNCIGQDIICVIAPICQQDFRADPFNQVDSFFTIRSVPFCNKDSDWHTMRIHGQMYFGVEPPFVLDIS